MKSTKILHIAVCCLLAALCSSIAHAKVVAQVNRTRLALDETLTLTISKDSNSFFSEPDLSPLKKDFTVLGQSKSSNTQIINGSMTATVRWMVELAPKRAGQVNIPPLTVDKEQTDPISIRVEQTAPPQTRAEGEPLFVETSLDQKSVFVQSQLLFTIRIFWAVEAQINDPDDPVLNDALIEKLGDATYQKDINGQQYSVFERRYAIFPQKSGVLEIPSMPVKAMLPMHHRYGGFYDPFGTQGKRIRLRSNSARVTVIEKPPGYPARAAWLPADSLAVKAQWSHDPQDLKVGESTTITITTTAQGLMAAQLPPIAIAEVDKIKLYQNKAEEKNSKDAGGVTGVRKETIALIPTRPGELELPEIRVPWWDKQQKKVRYARAPATRLVIHGTAPTARNETPAPPATIPPPTVTEKNKTIAPVSPQSAPLFWIMLCGGLAMAWLATTLLLLRTRRHLNGVGAATEARQPRAAAVACSEENAFKQLSLACRKNELAEAKATLLVWAKAFWPAENIRSGADIESVAPDSELPALVAEMDTLLYDRKEQADQWDGIRLRRRVQEIRTTARRAGKKNKKSALPQLYTNKV